MLHEDEVELLRVTLAERRMQVAADVEASALPATAERGPGLLARIRGLFRLDPAHLPVSHQSALRMQGRLSR